jgi:hypothetical protein
MTGKWRGVRDDDPRMELTGRKGGLGRKKRKGMNYFLMCDIGDYFFLNEKGQNWYL